MRFQRLEIASLSALLALAACAGTPTDPNGNGASNGGQDPAPATRVHLLERVDDTGVIQLYADGFDGLSLRDKVLCFHLANAAIAGRDIFIDQKFGHSLAIR